MGTGRWPGSAWALPSFSAMGPALIWGTCGHRAQSAAWQFTARVAGPRSVYVLSGTFGVIWPRLLGSCPLGHVGTRKSSSRGGFENHILTEPTAMHAAPPALGHVRSRAHWSRGRTGPHLGSSDFLGPLGDASASPISCLHFVGGPVGRWSPGLFASETWE